MTKLLRLDFADLKYPPSPSVVKAVKKAIKKINEYPDETYASLKAVLAEKYKCDPSYFLIGNGLDEVIDLITTAFCRESDAVLIPTPTFSQFAEAARRHKVVPVTVNCMDGNKFEIDGTSVLNAVTDKTKIIWLCSPNNPTGTTVSQKTIELLLSKTNCIVVVDEALADFCGITNSELVKKYDRFVILRSFSKSYCIAGLRLGFAIAQSAVIDKINKIKQIFNVNSLAVEAAIATLNDQKYYDSLWVEFKNEKNKVIEELQKLGVNIVGKEANILLMDFGTRQKSEQVYNRLLKNGIKLFPGWDVEFTDLDGRFLRVVVGKPKDNEKFLRALKSCLGV